MPTNETRDGGTTLGPDAAAPDANPGSAKDARPVTDAKPIHSLPTPKGPLCLGADCDGKNAFYGLIDRIRLYGRPLEADEIIAHAARKYEACTEASSCAGEWAFDAPAADGAFASGGETPLPAKIVGEVVLVDGPDGKAPQLAGKGYLQLEMAPALTFKATMTVEAWVRRAACPPKASCASMRIASSTGSFQYEHHAGGQTTRLPAAGYIGDPWSKQDSWAHVAFVLDVPHNFFMFYVNGKKASSLQRW